MHERKHPYQVMVISQLAVGDRYAFVSARPSTDGTYPDEEVNVSIKVMAGVMSDTIDRGLQTGWDLAGLRLDGTMISSVIPISAVLGVRFGDVLGRIQFGNVHRDGFVTVHQDGWNDTYDKNDHPTLAYWTAQRIWRGWDYVGSYLDCPAFNCSGSKHTITHKCVRVVVPEDRWFADPRIHAVCDDATDSDIERSVQTRTDNNLRHVFGY